MISAVGDYYGDNRNNSGRVVFEEVYSLSTMQQQRALNMHRAPSAAVSYRYCINIFYCIIIDDIFTLLVHTRATVYDTNIKKAL